MSKIFPTSYFGNIQYYKELFQEDSIIIEAFEHFPKQTFRNRCEILTPNGIQALSIPVIKQQGSKTYTIDVEISPLNDWRKDHWKAIESAYSSSPYFDYYSSEIFELIYNSERNLLKFNLAILDRIKKWLQIETLITFSHEYELINHDSIDYRLKLGNKKKENFNISLPYTQVFNEKEHFNDNLSIIDAIFCLGPLTRKLLY